MFSFNKNNFLSKFFKPAFIDKKKFFKMFAESSLGAFWFEVVPIFSIPYVLILVNSNQFDKLFNFSIFIIFLYLVLWFIHSKIRKWDTSFFYFLQYQIENLYRQEILLKDNNISESMGSGKIQSIVQKGISKWANSLWEILYQIPRTLVIVISGIFIVYPLGLFYLYSFIIILVSSSFAFVLFKKKELIFQEENNDLDDLKNSASVKSIMSKNEIIFSGKTLFESNLIKNFNLKQIKITNKASYYEFFADLSISGVSTILPFLSIIYFIFNYQNNLEKIPLLITFIYFSSRLSNLMYGFLWMFRKFLESYPEIKNFINFIENTPKIKNYENGETFLHKNGKIEFKNVSLAYENKNVLDNFNLNIEPGKKIALIGKSGSGKTTIAKLALGYLHPQNGKVFVDDQDLQNVSLKSYYKYIGYLTQEPMVFDGSIKENLLYAISEEDIKNIDEGKIVEVLKKAKCDFVLEMKNGLETQIGEKGVRLSGGERQRLAIAKLFLKNPEIIILDEPTSALDSFSEEFVTNAMNELFKGRTVIIIAHRLQTVKNADEIIVLEKGEIVERGNHKSLIKLSGHYSKMLEMQSGF